MHPLDDVSTVVEHSADVFCVHCTREVWVAVVPAVSTRRAYPLWEEGGKKKGSGAMPREKFHISAVYRLAGNQEP